MDTEESAAAVKIDEASP
jgi:hypothetical protein